MTSSTPKQLCEALASLDTQFVQVRSEPSTWVERTNEQMLRRGGDFNFLYLFVDDNLAKGLVRVVWSYSPSILQDEADLEEIVKELHDDIWDSVREFEAIQMADSIGRAL